MANAEEKYNGVWHGSKDAYTPYDRKEDMARWLFQEFRDFIEGYPLQTFSVTEEWLRVNHGAGESVTLRLEMTVYYM